MSIVKINSESKIPLYRQIVESIEEAILDNHLKIGDQLPSLNYIKNTFKISRDTVLTAFNELKNKGLIDSTIGKGYYVMSDDIDIKLKIFVLFDELNAFKEDLYQSFIKYLGSQTQVDVYFHHFDKKVFSQTIKNNLGNYSHYVIMPANLVGIEEDIKLIDKEKVYILDQTRPSLNQYATVYQDFEKDIYKALEQVEPQISKYKAFKLIFNSAKQPLALKTGFITFCEDKAVKYQILPEFNENLIFSQDLFLVLDDKHLILLLKRFKEKGLQLPEDCGVISYNEHMLKEVIYNGITTISTDFRLMGKQLSEMILTGQKNKIANINRIKIRNSI